MRDLTATVEAGFAVLEKKTAFGVDIRRSSGCEIVLKKERECWIRTQLGETLCFKCTCSTRSVIDQCHGKKDSVDSDEIITQFSLKEWGQFWTRSLNHLCSSLLTIINKHGYIPGSSETKTAARATAPVNREEKMSKRTPSHRPLASNTINDFVCTSWHLQPTRNVLFTPSFTVTTARKASTYDTVQLGCGVRRNLLRVSGIFFKAVFSPEFLLFWTCLFLLKQDL